jgi:tetratricopeptide (TPR) repeat protein/transglutaminase-like putative cysteine protease
MRIKIALALAGLIPAGAQAAAADKPVIGPPPAWVKPVPLPAAPAGGEAPVRILLQDQQVSFETGRETVYVETAFKIQTPQGLAGAGNISFPWRPDKDVLTVHKLQILRGAQVIDVLASGQTFTVVRRETNLENSVLDGVLTATIQPEGLQVGDIVDLAVSVSSSDPVLNGHVESLGAAWNGLQIARAHLRMQWPTALGLRLRATAALPPLKPVKSGAMSSVELSLDNVEPLLRPKGAPARFVIARLVEASDFDSWSRIASLMAPLYDKAAAVAPQGPLRTELDRIRAASTDPKARAQAALTLVQDRVRYVLLAMGEGGLVPADAETTWSRRFGDCKGKTALLLALLHDLGIEAQPVLVSTVLGDGLDQRLPIVGLFDHVLVRATIGGHAYWLDGTRTGDHNLDAIRIPSFGWGLPVQPAGATLVRLLPPPLDRPSEEVAIRIDASGGITAPAPTRVETILRGDEALGMNLSLAAKAPDVRERALKDYWKERYDFIEPRKVNATFDAGAGEEHLTLEGDAKMDWRGEHYETDGTGIGYKADFARDPGPDRDAPFAVPYPLFERTVETILLPPHAGLFKPGDNIEVDQTSAGIEYRRHATLAGNVFTIERSARAVAPEFPAAAAPAAQAALTALSEKTAYLLEPHNYAMTAREQAATLAATPTDAYGFVARGNLLMARDRQDEAIADFTRALALEPKDVWALADRAFAHLWKNDAAAATVDLDAAAAIDPRNVVIFRARGLMAERKGASADAIAAFSRALELEPDDSFSLGHRVTAYRTAGDVAHALADSAALLKLKPDWTDGYLLRANLLRGSGRTDEALAEAAAATAANPDDVYAHVVAARIYAVYHKQAEAMREYDRAIAIKPESYIYLNRSLTREKEDLAGRRADIEAALKLDPKSSDALTAKARLIDDGGDRAAAIAAWTAALAASPEDSDMLIGRGIAYVRAGQDAPAERDFAAARARNAEPVALNNMCWTKAIAGVALQSALEDCDLALGKAPDTPGFLDSRGLVLLRLGRIDEAIAAYDKALAKRPSQPSSLFGRAAAWAKKGDKARSDADVAAALKADPNVRSEFERYGIRI